MCMLICRCMSFVGRSRRVFELGWVVMTNGLRVLMIDAATTECGLISDIMASELEILVLVSLRYKR